MKLKPGDIIIIIIAMGAITFLTFSLFSNQVNNKNCHIITPEKEYIYPLHIDQSIEIKGSLGISHIEIKNNHVHMLSSPCSLKTCIKRGEISEVGSWIACLPNKILIIIKGKKSEKAEIDILSE
ncbi:MAG: NusG domain II-containing protein [Spirochaetales bacterium]|nr:NusG domain II-containing protein [Spirochaetales bacterium]